MKQKKKNDKNSNKKRNAADLLNSRNRKCNWTESYFVSIYFLQPLFLEGILLA
jgi:hypothetical protein